MLRLLVALIYLSSFSASAEEENIWHCVASNMIVVNDDFIVSEKGWQEEFLLTVNSNKLVLKFDTGHIFEYKITRKSGRTYISSEAHGLSHWSFYLSPNDANRYTHFKSTPFDSELRTGECKEFG